MVTKTFKVLNVVENFAKIWRFLPFCDGSIAGKITLCNNVFIGSSEYSEVWYSLLFF